LNMLIVEEYHASVVARALAVNCERARLYASSWTDTVNPQHLLNQ